MRALRGQRALRHIGQDAADLVEAQCAVRVQAVEYRAFPFAADDGKRSFHRAAFGHSRSLGAVCGGMAVSFM